MAAPILKWAGGKRRLLPEIRARVPDSLGVYHEPFLGGGAVLLDLEPERARAGDVNAELIGTLTVVRDDLPALLAALREHAAAHSPEHYYAVRAMDRAPDWAGVDPVTRAARLLYLNKTCFNGLHRVNRAGHFNVPYGRHRNPNIVNEAGLRAARDYFAGAGVRLAVAGFEETCAAAGRGDFVYLDPPYDAVSDTANFTGYAAAGFGRAEQIRLRETCADLDARGARFLLSNAATGFIRELYADYRVEIVQAPRAINANAARRGKVDEVLVRNY